MEEHNSNSSPPRNLSTALALILFDALLWFGLSMVYALELHPAVSAVGYVRWIYAGLALITCGVLIGLQELLRRRNRLAFRISIALLMLIALLTLTDEFGTADLVVLLLHLAPLGLLMRSRIWYFQS